MSWSMIWLQQWPRCQTAEEIVEQVRQPNSGPRKKMGRAKPVEGGNLEKDAAAEPMATKAGSMTNELPPVVVAAAHKAFDRLSAD